MSGAIMAEWVWQGCHTLLQIVVHIYDITFDAQSPGRRLRIKRRGKRTEKDPKEKVLLNEIFDKKINILL